MTDVKLGVESEGAVGEFPTQSHLPQAMTASRGHGRTGRCCESLFPSLCSKVVLISFAFLIHLTDPFFVWLKSPDKDRFSW